MKNIVLLLFVLNLQISAKVTSQNTVTMHMEDASLLECIKEIERQTDLGTFYNYRKVRKVKGLNVKFDEETIENALNDIFNGTKFTYTIKNKVILIKEKPQIELSVVKETETMQEPIKITGIVQSTENNMPIPGATVFVKSQPEIGTITDNEGKYMLNVPPSATTLVYSFVGMEAQEVEIAGQTIINIELEPSILGLDEVIVTGYTRGSRLTQSSSSGKISSERFVSQVTTNLDERMEGLATGLTINSVTPDGGQERLELVLRGISTFDEEGELYDPTMQDRNALNRQPLIVVDGFPYEGPFNDIDQSTIESIDVLKDAAATALWGLRASNGVIIITTKRGKAGAPKVSFTSNWTFGTKQDLSGLGLASASDLIAVKSNDKLLNGGGYSDTPYNVANYEAYTWVYDPVLGWIQVLQENLFYKYSAVDAFDNIWVQYYAGDITEEQRDAALTQLGQNNVIPQFEDELLQRGFASNNTLSISGGTDFSVYNLTTSYTTENSPEKGDEFDRFNVTLTNDLKLAEKLSAQVDMAIAKTNDRMNAIGVSSLYTGSNAIKTYDQLVDENGNLLNITDVYAPHKEEFLNYGFDDIGYNPIREQGFNDNLSTNFNLRIAGGLKYDIASWLKLDIKYQYNKTENGIRNYRNPDSYYMARTNNRYITSLNINGSGVERAVPYGGVLEKQATTNINNIARGMLNFFKIFDDVHSVRAIAGMEASENNYTLNQQYFVGYNDKTGQYADRFDHHQYGTYGTITNSILGGSYFGGDNIEYIPEIESRSISSFFNVGYSFKAKYNIEASAKVDQTTAVGVDQRLANNFYWAVSGSWNIAEEDFIDYQWLDALKIRASLGRNGNLRRGQTTETTITYGASDTYTGLPDAYVGSWGNPNLGPEETTTINLGLDFALFNRLSVMFDLYDKQSRDLMVNQNTNPTYGLGQVYVNEGEISNKGVELSIKADVIKMDEFKWQTDLNISYNKNEVLKYGDRDPVSGSSYYYDVQSGRTKIIGEDISVQARYSWAGLNDNGDPQVYNKDGEIIAWNDAEFSELTQDDMVTTKPFIAPTFGGFNNVFTYKNFSLGAFITFKFGHVFQETLDVKYPDAPASYDWVTGRHEDIANAWQQAGDELNTDIPAMPRDASEFDYDRKSAFILSDYAMHNASHIRLKDITLKYHFSKDLISKIGMEKANIMFQVRNLGLIWKANDADIDPESVPFSGRAITFAGNFDQAYRPGIKVPVSFVIGANFEF